MPGGDIPSDLSMGLLAGDSRDRNLNIVKLLLPNTIIAKIKSMRRGMMNRVAAVVCYDDLAMNMEEPAWSVQSVADTKGLPNWVSNLKAIDDTKRVTPVTLYDKVSRRTMTVCLVFRVEAGELTRLPQGRLNLRLNCLHFKAPTLNRSSPTSCLLYRDTDS